MRLVSPREAGARVAAAITKQWPAAVCAEIAGTEPFRATVRLRPGVRSSTDVASLGFDLWHEWAQSWHDVAAERLSAVEVGDSRMVVEGVPDQVPVELVVTGLDAALGLVGLVGAAAPEVDLDRVRRIARELREAGAALTPATLRSAVRLSDVDARVLTKAVGWLAEHPDLSGSTARQVGVPEMHSKWLEQHGRVLREVTGRDLRAELRPRLAVVHLTYVDPEYLATGARRHDAWTTDDAHDLPYTPRTVLVVENRDSRLWFPPVQDAFVVEGGGRAAASLLAGVPWVRRAENVVYWGDIDADGFAILDHFRRALAAPGDDGTPGRDVASILMDAMAAQRYAHLGVSTDKDGRPIPPSATHLPHLSADETAAYHLVATAGQAEFRRIEQERLPELDAQVALLALLAAATSWPS
ncbi:Wadjet anti-phage system protein JetD domain-containing protein [Promicromonospora sp. CA-289599]|uniref:Wadjet anti-phage system protein JetD domain-containing protein n=1 Tax=Promicromonospora sp. CA-289599 TaxID=3240014 RepID=UPI003D8DECE2